MMKKLNQIERKVKSVQEAELQFNIQRESEKEKLGMQEGKDFGSGLEGGSIDR